MPSKPRYFEDLPDHVRVDRARYLPLTPAKPDRRKRYRTPYVFKYSPRKWWLVYSAPAATGTGPFQSRKRAEAWFNSNGR